MPTTLARGVILGSIDYAEYDRIITIFTEQFGKLILLARGVNKLTSKNRYSLGTFNYSNIEFFRSRKPNSLSRLKTSSIIQSHDFISENYPCYLYASSLNYLIQYGLEIGQIQKNIYRIFLLALQNFNAGYEILKSFVYFLFYSLDTFGGPKNRGNCFRCYNFETEYSLFDIHGLYFICNKCQLKSEKLQDKEWIKFIYFITNHNMSEALNWPVEEQYVIILGKILLNYYREALGLDGLVLKLIDQEPIFKSINNELINFLLKY